MGALSRAAAAGLAAVLVLAACRDDAASPARPSGAPAQGVEQVISETKAVELARAACAGKAEIPAGTAARVVFDAGRCVVTFPTALAPGTRGSDYHAKVTLDARTGAVIEVLSGD